MLTYEIMGLLALGILWVNTILLVGAAMTPLGELLGRLRRWRRDGLLRATVEAGIEDGTFARYEVEQTGHKAADDDDQAAIAFHDRAYRSYLFGGALNVNGATLEVGPEIADAEVWLSGRDKEQAAACPGADVFDDAYKQARKAKGWRRTVRRDVSKGDDIYLHLVRDDSRLRAPEDAPALVATFDPRPWCRAKAALVVGFQLLVLSLAGGITYLALYPPLFGTISTIGGVAGLVYFVTIQPVGVNLREATLAPPKAALRGSWRRPQEGPAARPTGRPVANGT